MSHHSTPHLHNKRTPGLGPMAPENASYGVASQNSAKPLMDASTSISDAQATNAKQLLNAYVYDFLIKSRLPQTARIFVNEAEVPTMQNGLSSLLNKNLPQINNPGANTLPPTPNSYQQFQKDNNLPNLLMAMDAPQGFLFEWWQVFWDVFQAKNNKGSSQFAMQYYQLQVMKQRQQHEVQGLNVQPNIAGVPNPAFQQHPLLLQLQQMVQPPGLLLGPQPPGSAGGAVNQLFPPPTPQQQQQLAQMDPQLQQRYMMQMMMKQQQQQQQQQPQPQNRIQQHAQTQMNNLRQQAAVAAQQQQLLFDANGQRLNQNRPFQQQPMNPMQQFQQQQPINGMPFQQQQPQQQQPMNGGTPVQYNQAQPPVLVSRMNSVSGPKNGTGAETPIMMSQGPSNPGSAGPVATPGGAGGPPNRNMNALQDYQMQLMLLEKQNKKRLDIARSNGGTDISLLNALNASMLPPHVQQQGMQPNSQPPQQQVPAKSSPAPSPVINNKLSPSSSAGNKRKKEPPAKRGRKPSAASVNANGSNVAMTPGSSAPGSINNTSSNASNHPTPGSINTNAPGLIKKDNSPLTPNAEVDSLKRKRKNAAGSDSPKKQAITKSAGAKKEKSIKEVDESSVKKEDDPSKMPPPSAFNSVGQSGQIFPVEILGGNPSGDQNFFGGSNPSNGGLDDIDFDFNLFLDGGADNGLNDSISGFNWGNVDTIEGSE